MWLRVGMAGLLGGVHSGNEGPEAKGRRGGVKSCHDEGITKYRRPCTGSVQKHIRLPLMRTLKQAMRPASV